MRRQLVWICLCLPFPSIASSAEDSLRLLSMPAQVEVRDGALPIDSSFRVTVTEQKRVTAQPDGIAGSYEIPPPQGGLVIAIVPALISSTSDGSSAR